jgi:hypothetical protein
MMANIVKMCKKATQQCEMLSLNWHRYQIQTSASSFNHAAVSSQELITDFTHGGARFYIPSQGGVSKFFSPCRIPTP